ncbi:HAAS domain-containing protein [Neobacillus massiliamazoniensis]|uniref:Membrane protein n=1 Tax=Neobacillus massiliamazoniensis TaxID=1499688 RepID=A0A0U1NTB4_9BACI|nr:hypothetical protein [Neobacillus massiliamazoniensis]CRK81286.1 membrane protein [Neobacillus massiliamazoniensis]
MKLSAKSQEFLDNLQLYLFSSGKKEAEIAEVIEELKDHLCEAEKDGKSVEHIIGQPPEQYMELLSKEMNTDYKGLIKIIPIFILGAFAYILLDNTIRGSIHFSIYQLIGYPVISIVMLGMYVMTFKLIAKRKLTRIKRFGILYGLSLFSIGSFIALLLFDKKFGTPLFQIDTVIGRTIVAAIAIIIFIGIAIWSKTWVSIIIPAIISVPQLLVKFLPVHGQTKLIFPTVLMFLGLIVFFTVHSRLEKKDAKQ